MLFRSPYNLLVSFRRHQVPENYNGSGATCQTFGAMVGAYEGISLKEGALTDATYEFAKWMTYLATIFGLVAVFSDCTILTCCPCKRVRSRSMQIKVVGGMQMAVGIMLGLSFTVMNSSFCKESWPDLEGYMADAGSAVPENAKYSCSLAWGGGCVAVSVALWILAAFMTLGKGRSDRLEEMKKEQQQADAEAQRTLRREGKDGDGGEKSGGEDLERKKEEEAAATNEEIEGI